MIDISNIDHVVMIAFWLSFTRWVTILVQLPIYDHQSIPGMVKIFSSLVIAYAFFPHTQGIVEKEIYHLGVENFWALTIVHALIGLTIGFVVKSLMGIFVSAGMIITQQLGFGAMRYFDPTMSQQIGPFEKLIHITFIVIIIGSGAILPMFKGIFISFQTINIFSLERMVQSPQMFTALFKNIFASSILLASPIIFTNMLITAIMGIIARTVPQMNVLMVSFVINIGLGLLVFFTVSNEFFVVAYQIYVKNLASWFQFIT